MMFKKFNLQDDILVKVDRASMMNSLVIRYDLEMDLYDFWEQQSYPPMAWR